MVKVSGSYKFGKVKDASRGGATALRVQGARMGVMQIFNHAEGMSGTACISDLELAYK